MSDDTILTRGLGGDGTDILTGGLTSLTGTGGGGGTPPPATATYDPTQIQVSLLFQVRFHASDTDVTNAIWSDAELLYLLIDDRSSGEPMLAAALALEAGATDAAKLAIKSKTETVDTDLSLISATMIKAAAVLRAMSGWNEDFSDVPDAVFTMGSASQGTLGTMDGLWSQMGGP